MTTNKGRGGIAAGVALYTQALLQLGYEVDVLCYTGERVRMLLDELLKGPGAARGALRLHELPRGFRVQALYNPFLRLRLRRLVAGADILLFHNAAPLGMMCALAPARPALAVSHMGKSKHFEGADFTFCVSRGVRDRLLRNPFLARAPQRAMVVEPALPFLPPPPAPRTAGPCMTVGTLGRIVPSKGFEDLLAAFARLPREDFRLLIMGEGPQKDELQAQARTLGIAGTVSFLEWSEDTARFYNGIDIFCSPSRNEPFGLVIIEAMAHGLPVIATQTDGAGDIIRDGETGLIVPRQDAGALGRAIARLAKDEALRNRLGRAAYDAAAARYSPRAFEQRLAGALDAALRACKMEGAGSLAQRPWWKRF